jgi:hypothetical protein
MDNIELEEATIKNVIEALYKQLKDYDENEDDLEFENINWSIFRLENALKGSKLIHIHTEKLPDNFKIEDGYWLINNKAYYLCQPRR